MLYSKGVNCMVCLLPTKFINALSIILCNAKDWDGYRTKRQEKKDANTENDCNDYEETKLTDDEN